MNAFSDAPTPTELYRRWERRHWHAQAVDFSQDRREWLDLSDEERWQWCWLAGFSHFRASEIHAVLCSARLLPCLARPEQKYFLATQVADEARHAYFFQRFYDEVMGAELPTETQGPLTISPSYQRLFLDSLTEVVDSAVNHPSHANVAVAAFQAFVVLEGSIAIATFTVIRRILTKLNRFPGLLSEARTVWNFSAPGHFRNGAVLARRSHCPFAGASSAVFRSVGATSGAQGSTQIAWVGSVRASPPSVHPLATQTPGTGHRRRLHRTLHGRGVIAWINALARWSLRIRAMRCWSRD